MFPALVSLGFFVFVWLMFKTYLDYKRGSRESSTNRDDSKP